MCKYNYNIYININKEYIYKKYMNAYKYINMKIYEYIRIAKKYKYI